MAETVHPEGMLNPDIGFFSVALRLPTVKIQNRQQSPQQLQ
jgi:hypothetical protein